MNIDCNEVCGDGITFSYPCDNWLGILFDGCTDACQIEENFSCQVNNTITTCSYNGTVTIELVDIELDRVSGFYIITLIVTPPLYAYKISFDNEL